jgi:hypothetical protein
MYRCRTHPCFRRHRGQPCLASESWQRDYVHFLETDQERKWPTHGDPTLRARVGIARYTS